MDKKKLFKKELTEFKEAYPNYDATLRGGELLNKPAVGDEPTKFNGQENDLQSKCFLWAWNTYPEHRRMLFCVNNNSKHIVEAMQNKALGVVEGVSDMILIYYKGLACLEFKRPATEGRRAGKQRAAQVAFQEAVEVRGHFYFLINNFDAFKYIYMRLISVSAECPLTLKKERIKND